MVCILLGIKHGFTFSHGLIDYIVLFPKSTNALWLFVLGPIWAVVYFLVFSFFIRKFKLMTPGREAVDEAAAAAHMSRKPICFTRTSRNGLSRTMCFNASSLSRT
jgi:PTS system glucose-specific IIC component